MFFLRRSLSVVLSFSLVTLLFVGCDLFGDDNSEPSVDAVVVVGTQVGTDFLNTGQFGLSATPLDDNEDSILNSDVGVEVSIQTPVSVSPESEFENIDEPSGNPLAVPIDFDESGSLSSTDPDRDRVEGGKEFVDELERQGIDYESSVLGYSGSCTPADSPSGAGDFRCSRLIQGFTDSPSELKNAVEQVAADGGTPTYGALLEALEYSENQRSTSSFEKSIVLFSDGQPNDDNLQARKKEVCSEAVPTQKDSPIFAVGLGPGSDQSNSTDEAAVQEMNEIANCSNGAYTGIDPNNPRQSARDIFSDFGIAVSKGTVILTVTVNSNLDDFDEGDMVEGTLTIESGGATAESDFSFRVPAANTSSEAFHYSE